MASSSGEPSRSTEVESPLRGIGAAFVRRRPSLRPFRSSPHAASETNRRPGSRGEPRVKQSQGLYEPKVEVVPKAFRSRAPVVPEGREYASALPSMVDQAAAALPGLRLGQIETLWIEQRTVLDVHGELEKGPRTQWPKDLGRSASVPDSLVVANGGVVSEPCFLQN